MRLLLPALAALLFAAPARAADDGWSPRFTQVTGEVFVYAKGADEGLPAAEGTPVEEGDRIETGDDASAEVALEPDSLMDLGSNTSFTVGSLAKTTSWFSLDLGSFVAKIRTLAEEGRGAMEVRTPTAVAAVRGTEFGLKVGEAGDTDVGVYDEGLVAVTAAGAKGGEEADLTSNKEVTLSAGETGGFAPHPLERLKDRRQVLTRLLARRAVVRRGWKNFSRRQVRAARVAWRKAMRARMKAMPKGERERLLGRFSQRRQRFKGMMRKIMQRRGRRGQRGERGQRGQRGERGQRGQNGMRQGRQGRRNGPGRRRGRFGRFFRRGGERREGTGGP
ncbi:MAG: FecR domain-containing protein, partial [Elusimicrobia bacterium]|nr:FecR domain-containing protein [Elusimicrobiota bacterium]